jgi:uncharacterized membrane protein
MSDEAALRRAKRPRTILAGPYGHPIHAILVTIPIGSWTAALIFDFVAFFADDTEVFTRGALWLTGIGIVGALLAAIMGVLDLSTLEKGTRARKIALFHLDVNGSAIILFTISFLVRLGNDDSQVSVLGFVLSLIAYLLVGVGGMLGGELVYRHGVRVADETTQVRAFRH